MDIDTSKAHTTNYQNAFIRVASDSTARTGVVPPERGGKTTAAGLQYQMIVTAPYGHTSDDIVFAASAAGRALGSRPAKKAYEAARTQFFSKGQACLRASALGKQYGWGAHFDAQGRVAIYAVDSHDYRRLAEDGTLKQFQAMRSKSR